MVTPNIDSALKLAHQIAPDVCLRMADHLTPVSPEDYRQLSPVPPDTGVIAIANRPAIDVEHILGSSANAPILLLENPRNPFNIGATVRVAAAADAAGVLVTGQQDPWHPAAIVSAAGLQFALPVAHTVEIPDSTRPIVAMDPQGEPMPWEHVPATAILAFGTERHGVSDELLSRASRQLSIPMRPGVSSLNLATSAAVALYALKFR